MNWGTRDGLASLMLTSAPPSSAGAAASAASRSWRFASLRSRKRDGARSVIEKRHKVKPRKSKPRMTAKMRLNSSAPVRSTRRLLSSVWVQ